MERKFDCTSNDWREYHHLRLIQLLKVTLERDHSGLQGQALRPAILQNTVYITILRLLATYTVCTLVQAAPLTRLLLGLGDAGES